MNPDTAKSSQVRTISLPNKPKRVNGSSESDATHDTMVASRTVSRPKAT